MALEPLSDAELRVLGKAVAEDEIGARISLARAALEALEAQQARLMSFDFGGGISGDDGGTAEAEQLCSGRAEGEPTALKRRRRLENSGGGGGEVKLVIVMRTDLKMGKGKLAAQASHAAVGAVCGDNFAGDDHETARELAAWRRGGSKTVCTKVGSSEELAAVVRAARLAGLPLTEVADAGRTQVAAGSRTCAAVGPADAAAIDEVTSALKLL